MIRPARFNDLSAQHRGPIAVCLLTCDRPELTRVTVDSFVQHNANRDDLILLHVDGGSQTDENRQIAKSAGFHTLFYADPMHRIGQLAALRTFLNEVITQRFPWVLWLENDWESVAPVPTPQQFPHRAATLRLFGIQKFRSGKRALAGRYRIGTQDRIRWMALEHSPGWEWGYAHWGAGGTIIQTSVLVTQAQKAQRLKDVITSNRHLASARPTENIMWSIGEETTAGFMG